MFSQGPEPPVPAAARTGPALLRVFRQLRGAAITGHHVDPSELKRAFNQSPLGRGFSSDTTQEVFRGAMSRVHNPGFADDCCKRTPVRAFNLNPATVMTCRMRMSFSPAYSSK